jgi:cell division protease FtsH
MKPRMLAASTRPIAEALLHSLRSSGRLSRLRPAPSDDGDYDLASHQFSLDLEDESDDKFERDADPVLHPDEAAAAVLLGRAFEPSRDVLARLRQPDTLAIIEVPHPDYVEVITKVLRKQVLGFEAPVLDREDLAKRMTVAATGTVAIFESSDEASSRQTAANSAAIAAAVQLRCAIIGITSDLSLLPRELVSLAEHRIVVPPLDARAIGAVIEAVTGKHPSAQIDEKTASRATLEALSIGVRADLGPERSLARLRQLLTDQHRKEDGPLLSEMYGLGQAKQWGLDLAADLRAYVAGKLPWSACPKGLLLSGPPGTGKTSFARALSREAGVHFIATSYSAWQSQKDGHLGSVTAAIRKVFAEAKANRPCIVFIDEIDSLPARGSAGHNDSWFTAVLNCLLEQLDGYEKRDGVVICAACNDPARLDRALIRAGRLDNHIVIPLPDVPALVGIFRMHLGSDLEGADLRAAALAARGHTGADVERWVRVARRGSRTAGRALTLQDLLEAVRGGEPDWPDDVRRRVAFHEAGHAVVLLALGIAEPTALSIGGAGGLAESELGEMQAETRTTMEGFLVALLGGRAAEQISFGEVTAGAGGTEGSDLDRCTRLAIRLETAFGFGNLGLICLPDGLNPRDLLAFEPLRTAVTSTMDRAYATALDILNKNRGALDALAAALFSAGYLDRVEIEAVLKEAPLCPQAVVNIPASRHPDPVRAALGQTQAEADTPPLTASSLVAP